jgi:hypothetical protein
MRPPRCKPFEPARRIHRKVVQSVRFDGQTLLVDIEVKEGGRARVEFRNTVGFRVLDERDLTEFWNTYSEPNGWLYEVEAGGWLELERTRPRFDAPQFYGRVREYFIVDDKCISVLSNEAPQIVDVREESESS